MSGCIIKIATMNETIILELRGTGILLRVCSIDNHDLKTLERLAKAYGEDLSTAWFDPSFRWRKEVRTVLEQIFIISTYRGLLKDGRSFLEIRQPHQRRRKFTMTELLRTDQLFPLVKSSTFSYPAKTNGKSIVFEITHGIGCMGRFEIDAFNLAELELSIYKMPDQNQEAALFASHLGVALKCLMDDFLVRGTKLEKFEIS
jgi:hypothetical protein